MIFIKLIYDDKTYLYNLKFHYKTISIYKYINFNKIFNNKK